MRLLSLLLVVMDKLLLFQLLVMFGDGVVIKIKKERHGLILFLVLNLTSNASKVFQ